MNWKDFPNKLLKFLSSLKLAVFVILALAALIATGTFIEAKYMDANAAAKLVYKTPWMFATLGFLSLNLAAVMADRWPWKRRHVPFLCAHIGILLLLLGSAVTMRAGLDGTMRVGIGQSSRFVGSSNMELVVWSSFDGQRYTKLSEKEVDFYTHSPAKQNVILPTDAGNIQIIDYKPYMLASRRVHATEDDKAGAALQFQMRNARVDVTEWVVQSKKGEVGTHDFGPAQIHLAPDPGHGTGANEIFIQAGKKDQYLYSIYNKEGLKIKKGSVKENEVLETGWMGLQFKVLRYFSQAEFSWDFQESNHLTPLTTGAIKLNFQGKDHWLQEDDVLKLFTEKAVYIVTYGHRRVDVGFEVFLKKFNVGLYPGTQRPASYESLVEVTGEGEHVISMNEPFKYKGLTIYQASFQNGPDGTPVASVFSVNYDPGRWLKYLGSLIITLGVIDLFYERRKSARAAMAPKKWESS